ncbi:MAG TPA: YkgJ family cysteine cluster protein [Kofleriaceae bacterium]|jgi:Fe-S-cluster containining protein
MADPDADGAYGTAAPDAPATRAELERAVRSLHMSDLELRDTLLKLAARVIALTDELTRRVDGVEPLPAPPGTPAPPPTMTIEAATEVALEPTLAAIRASDARIATRVSLDLGGPKYQTESPPVPCAELIPLCHARCCRLSFSLSTEDLDEGVIRWDYGQPYLIAQRASDGYCVHNDPDSRGCTVHAHRPRVCRSYDCRKDPRVWIDYDQRIPAPLVGGKVDIKAPSPAFDLFERARARAAAIARETLAISESFAEPAPRKGPRPA